MVRLWVNGTLLIYFLFIIIRVLESYLTTYMKKYRFTFISSGWYLILLNTDLGCYKDLVSQISDDSVLSIVYPA